MPTSETVSVPGTEAGVRRATEALDAWCLRQRLPADARRRLLTSLDEVLSNVVRHGFGERAGTIDITLVRDGDVLSAAVADNAAEFNPLTQPAPDVTAPLEARQPGGLGIALLRALAADVRYERRGTCNVLTLTWDLK
jgi:anti-sigma regulatory factor (Ser/Thr protein kinase)